MSSLRQPRSLVKLEAVREDLTLRLGVCGLRCRAELWLQVEDQSFTPVNFVIDSGASFSFMTVAQAAAFGLAVPPPESECDLPLLTAAGGLVVRVRPGRVRGWWDDRFAGHPLQFPVLFTVAGSLRTPPVIGLGGVVRLCRWTFDGRPTDQFPYGSLALDDTR